jgi:hypothetical protein
MAADFFRSAVGCFHDARSATGHNGKAKARNRRADLPGKFVVRTVRLDPRRTEDSHAWTDEVKNTKSAKKIEHDTEERDQFVEA